MLFLLVTLGWLLWRLTALVWIALVWIALFLAARLRIACFLSM